jgi:hypothetical protein
MTPSLDPIAVLAAFHRHAADELADVDVLEAGPAALVLQWRREVVDVELRPTLENEPVPERPLLALAPLESGVIARLLDDERLRAQLGVYDLARCAKASAVGASVFTYFEWFLLEAYGAKVVASSSFTAGLVERGILSLGMG